MPEKGKRERRQQIDELKTALAGILAHRRAPVTADGIREILATLRQVAIFDLVADSDAEQIARCAEVAHCVSTA